LYWKIKLNTTSIQKHLAINNIQQQQDVYLNISRETQIFFIYNYLSFLSCKIVNDAYYLHDNKTLHESMKVAAKDMMKERVVGFLEINLELTRSLFFTTENIIRAFIMKIKYTKVIRYWQGKHCQHNKNKVATLEVYNMDTFIKKKSVLTPKEFWKVKQHLPLATQSST